jgi:aminoglycoside phosphotransferase (APT) family kinase protein
MTLRTAARAGKRGLAGTGRYSVSAGHPAAIGSSLVTHGQDPAPARPTWTAELVVTPDLAAELIAGQFPDLAGAAVVPFATGWDNTVYRVGGEWLFRFPRRQIAIPGVRREIAVLPLLAPRLPLPIPDPRFAGQPTDRYPWPFFGARLVPGTELADSGLPEDGRTAAAAGTGRFLRALHDPALFALTADAGLPVDPNVRANPGFRARQARPVLERLARAGLWTPDPAVLALLEDADRAGDAPGAGPLVVCHGDLHLRHLLVGPDGAATGIIDWGDLCQGDPAVDLVIAYLAFAGPARAALLSAYGTPVPAARELTARTLAVSLAAMLAEYADSEGRPGLLAESLAGLRRAVAP